MKILALIVIYGVGVPSRMASSLVDLVMMGVDEVFLRLDRLVVWARKK